MNAISSKPVPSRPGWLFGILGRVEVLVALLYACCHLILDAVLGATH